MNREEAEEIADALLMRYEHINEKKELETIIEYINDLEAQLKSKDEHLDKNRSSYEMQAVRIRQSLVLEFSNIAKENPTKTFKEVPEMVDIDTAIEVINKVCGISHLDLNGTVKES